MVIGLFVALWIARYLGPDRFGLFSYAQSFVAIFATLGTLGLGDIVVRELVKGEKRRDEIIGTAFWLKVMGAIGVLLILMIAVRFTSNDQHTNAIVFIIASATIFQSFNVIDFYFQKSLRRLCIIVSKVCRFENIVKNCFSKKNKVCLWHNF